MARVIARTAQEHNLGGGENILGEREDHHTLCSVSTGLTLPNASFPSIFSGGSQQNDSCNFFQNDTTRRERHAKVSYFKEYFFLIHQFLLAWQEVVNCDLSAQLLHPYITIFLHISFDLLRFQALGSSSQSTAGSYFFRSVFCYARRATITWIGVPDPSFSMAKNRPCSHGFHV